MTNLLEAAKTALDTLVIYTNLSTVEEKIMLDSLVDDVIVELSQAIEQAEKQKREWVELTEQEIDNIFYETHLDEWDSAGIYAEKVVKAVLQKIKENNT